MLTAFVVGLVPFITFRLFLMTVREWYPSPCLLLGAVCCTAVTIRYLGVGGNVHCCDIVIDHQRGCSCYKFDARGQGAVATSTYTMKIVLASGRERQGELVFDLPATNVHPSW